MHLARLTSLAAIVAASALSVTSAAGAQDVDRWSFRAAIGPSMLTGEPGDATNVGFNLALAPERRIGASAFRLGVELSAGRYGLDPDGGEPGERVEGHLDVFGLALVGTYAIPTTGRVAPFARAGVGPYGVQASIDGLSPGDAVLDETDVGFFGGFGLELRDVRFSPSLEVRYQSISTSGTRTNFVPVMLGLRF